MLRVEASREPGRSIRVLVVDDDVTTRMICRAMLEDSGFVVDEAGDGVSGLEVAAGVRPDLVLLDLQMPGMDGFEMCRRLRESMQGEVLPVVVMTGLEDHDSIRAAFDAGVTDFVTKPLNYHLLAHRIRYILRNKFIADKLRESEQRLSDAYRVARLGYWAWDPLEDSAYFSVEALEILGVESSTRWVTIDDFVAHVDGRDRAAFGDVLRALRETGAEGALEYRVPDGVGGSRFVYQRTRVTGNGSPAGERVVGSVQDVTERRLTEERIRYLAYFDNVTGLPNRTFLKELLQNAIEKADEEGWVAAVMFLDLDNFKRINDTLGHDVGDRLLRDVAHRLNRCLRASDSVLHRQTGSVEQGATVDHLALGTKAVSRLGGDEFVILLNDLRSADDAAVVAERVAKELEVPFNVCGKDLEVSTSIGISTYPKDGTDVDTLLKHADVAMYRAKERGRAGYEFYTRAIGDQIERRLATETDLRSAVLGEEMVLHYQPKISLRTGKVYGVEGLIRWLHPRRGLLGPGEFIGVAEESGLILDLGRWALERACRDARRLRERGEALSVAVNVSAVQFHQPRFVRETMSTLEAERVPPEWIELELTESLLIDDTNASIEKLQELRQAGVRVSIDDFGTGYSSLGYLKRFALTGLKIDQGFVRDLTVDPSDVAIVEATIALAHSLGIEVIAEGVESGDQFQILLAQGCDAAQGFIFSPPMIWSDLVAWLDDARGVNFLALGERKEAECTSP